MKTDRPAAMGRSSQADEFVTLGCLCHDDPHFDHRSFHQRAHAMLADAPWLAEANIWSAAVAGNAKAVGGFLDAQPDLVNTGGPRGWTPLLCACYSRVKPIDQAHSTFEVARLLLERGADPNTYTWKGNADERLSQKGRRFTALSGVFGGGSTGFANQPPHQQWRLLAEMLLKRGAHPADGQALKTNQDASLELLVQYGLSPEHLGSTGVSLMGSALARAARLGSSAQVQLLLDAGCRMDEKTEGKLPWQHAIEFGQMEIARMLEAAGAPHPALSDVEHFTALCMAGDEAGARQLLADQPEIRALAPAALVKRAVATGRRAAVQLVLALGFDPNFQDDNGAIHMAGQLAADYDLVRLLLAGGASLELRDPWYDSTGIGWADFFDYGALRDNLLNEEAISIFDALDFDRLGRIGGILERDPAALNRPFSKCLSREPKPEDQQTPLLRAVARGQTEAVRTLLAHGADAAIRDGTGRSPLEFARELGNEEIRQLLEAASRQQTA